MTPAARRRAISSLLSARRSRNTCSVCSPSSGAGDRIAPGVSDIRTGGPVILTVPAKDGAAYLGDMPLTITADDTLSFPTDRTLQLFEPVLAGDVLSALRANLAGKAAVGPADFASVGINITYEDVKRAADANAMTVDDTLAMIDRTSDKDRSDHPTEYSPEMERDLSRLDDDGGPSVDS